MFASRFKPYPAAGRHRRWGIGGLPVELDRSGNPAMMSYIAPDWGGLSGLAGVSAMLRADRSSIMVLMRVALVAFAAALMMAGDRAQADPGKPGCCRTRQAAAPRCCCCPRPDAVVAAADNAADDHAAASILATPRTPACACAAPSPSPAHRTESPGVPRAPAGVELALDRPAATQGRSATWIRPVGPDLRRVETSRYLRLARLRI